MKFKTLKKNNQIRAEKIRLINEKGEQKGIITLKEALILAKETGLDLVQVAEKVDPPVCKLIDYGKYLYWQRKKGKSKNKKISETKSIRISFNISCHDLESKAVQAERFLKANCKIKIEMRLKGRERYLKDFAIDKLKKCLQEIKKRVAIKIERELKKTRTGYHLIITKA